MLESSLKVVYALSIEDAKAFDAQRMIRESQNLNSQQRVSNTVPSTSLLLFSLEESSR